MGTFGASLGVANGVSCPVRISNRSDPARKMSWERRRAAGSVSSDRCESVRSGDGQCSATGGNECDAGGRRTVCVPAGIAFGAPFAPVAPSAAPFPAARNPTPAPVAPIIAASSISISGAAKISRTSPFSVIVEKVGAAARRCFEAPPFPAEAAAAAVAAPPPPSPSTKSACGQQGHPTEQDEFSSRVDTCLSAEHPTMRARRGGCPLLLTMCMTPALCTDPIASTTTPRTSRRRSCGGISVFGQQVDSCCWKLATKRFRRSRGAQAVVPTAAAFAAAGKEWISAPRGSTARPRALPERF